MRTALLVAVGALVGAPARYLLDRALGPRLGVLTVNLLGSLLAGVVAGLAPPRAAVLLLLTGALGAFTTASAVAWQATERPERAARLLALHLAGGTALAGLGLVLGRALS